MATNVTITILDVRSTDAPNHSNIYIPSDRLTARTRAGEGPLIYATASPALAWASRSFSKASSAIL